MKKYRVDITVEIEGAKSQEEAHEIAQQYAAEGDSNMQYDKIPCKSIDISEPLEIPED